MSSDRHWGRLEYDIGGGAEVPRHVLGQLARGEVAVVLLTGLLSPQEFDANRTRIRDLLGQADTTRYVNGSLTTIGPFLAKYLARTDDYFRDAREAEAMLAGASFDLPDRIRAGLRKSLGLNSLEPAREPDGRRYGDSVVRLHADGVHNPLHNDNIMRDAAGSGLALAELTHQLSCVVCIEECETGGELKIYRRSWQRADEALKIEHGLGYHEAVLGGAACHTFKPQAGDVYLINPTYYHEILRVGGSNRTTLGFFLGFGDESLTDAVAWG